MITFDQTKKNNITFEGEAVRLSNELRAKPASTSINHKGERIDIPVKQGFDIETADFKIMINWLADTRIKKSESLVAFVHRCLSVRFPDKYTQNKSKIDNRYKLEQEMIESNSKNEIAWFGEVGFSNMVRLDGSLTKLNNKVVINRDDTVKIVRK
mgnify:CR=1 FL=1|tara:strand:+ start:959 stop:1423 length:465 start_codon:yes stop_codon:yes gene_type:complete